MNVRFPLFYLQIFVFFVLNFVRNNAFYDFREDAPDYHIAVAGSLLGLTREYREMLRIS